MALTKIVASRSGHRTTLIPFPGTVDDGSTLSLDFTTGVLDPRLTFTRSTNATFINSSGLVEWAAANMLSNSVWTDANATPTNWTLWTASGGSVSIPGSGLRTVSASAASQQPFLYQNYSLSQGLAYTLSVVVTEVSGTVKIEDVLAVISASSIVGYYIDGVLQTNTANQATTGKYAVVFVASAASHSVRCGAASQNLTTSACSITMHSPRLQPGRETNPSYVASPVGSSYQGPRFDHDPTAIGTPRGLLIEGSANNLVSRSETYSTGWSVSNLTIGASAVAPDGNSTATTISATATAATWLYQSVGSVSGTSITLSMWVKQGTMSSVKFLVYDTTAAATRGETTYTFSTNSFSGTTGGGTPRSVSYANGWYRLEFPVTTHISGNGLACYFAFGAQTVTAGQTVILWGCQAETGIGASSYIPTGASTGSRAADSAVIEDIGPLNYSTTNGTIYWSGIINKQPTNYITLIGFVTAANLPSYETFGNALSYFTAARGSGLSIGGLNEVSRTYSLRSLIKYASSVNTTSNPIVAVNLNGSASSVNKSGTGNLNAATKFVLGRPPVATYGVDYPSVTIANIKYWPTTKTATELAALTA